MPITFKLFIEKHLIISKWSGIITDDFIISEYTRAKDLGHWIPGQNIIVNLLDADMSRVTGEGLRRLFKFNQQEYSLDNPPPVKAAVVANKELDAYLTRIYGALLEGSSRTLRLFDNEEEALKWIER